MKYLVVLFFSFWSLFSKELSPKILFKGTVSESATLKELAACKVKVTYTKTGITIESFTDTKGNYAMSLNPGDFTVDYSFSGYSSVKATYELFPKSDTVVIKEVLLVDNSVSPEEVTVIEHKDKLIDEDIVSPSVIKHSSKDLARSTSRGVKEVGSISAGSYSRSSDVSFMGSRGDDAMSGEVSGERVTYLSAGTTGDIKAGTLTAGEINDFSKWVLWNDLGRSELKQFVSFWGILPKHRFSIQITNESKNPLADIAVELKDYSGKVIWRSRTDNTGKAELWANIFDTTDLSSGKYSIEATVEGKSYFIKNASSFSLALNKMVIPSVCRQPLNMDIVFAVDATGSMGDEISYLQVELYDVIEKVKKRNPGMSFKMGSVFYRDVNDSYLTVEQNLTSDIEKVMNFMKAQSADGGGDEPEAVEAAMEVAIGKFDWRPEARARVMFLVLDASPHHEKEVLDKIRKYTQLAAEKGIRIVPVVCSGIDKAGEYLMRSIALATNGNYIFLTDHSGIGHGHIAPSTDKYDVETLNVLLTRLLQQYIFMPDCNQKMNTDVVDSLQHADKDSTVNDSTFVKNPDIDKDSSGNSKPDAWFLKYYPNPCRGILQVEINAAISELFIADINGKLLMKVPVNKELGRLEIDLTQFPAGIYFLRYCVDGKCKSGKFVLVH